LRHKILQAFFPPLDRQIFAVLGMDHLRFLLYTRPRVYRLYVVLK
jgi:hypothetical protein